MSNPFFYTGSVNTHKNSVEKVSDLKKDFFKMCDTLYYDIEYLKTQFNFGINIDKYHKSKKEILYRNSKFMKYEMYKETPMLVLETDKKDKSICLSFTENINSYLCIGFEWNVCVLVSPNIFFGLHTYYELNDSNSKVVQFYIRNENCKSSTGNCEVKNMQSLVANIDKYQNYFTIFNVSDYNISDIDISPLKQKMEKDDVRLFEYILFCLKDKICVKNASH